MPKFFYLLIGSFSLLLGVIGAFFPILPTTPFLLLTSFCYARGSERFHTWFTHTHLYQKHLESFVTHRQMTLKSKIYLLTFASIMLAFPFYFVDLLWVRITISLLLIFKYYYLLFKVKTL